MRLNLWLVTASQFLHQFRLDFRHKPNKEHIIPNALSRLASTNVGCTNLFYSELDILFTYNTTLVKIYPTLISKILASYEYDEYWARLHRQVLANEDLDDNKALLPFVSGYFYRSNSNPYMLPHPKGPAGFSPKPAIPYPRNSPVVLEDSRLPPPNKTKLLYHVNRTIGNLRLCITPAMAPEILQIAYGEGHLSFSCCYEIVTHCWYIWGLTRLLREFIRHCPQCLQLQTRRHPPYGSLQSIKSPPMRFFTLTLDFILVLPLTKQGFNAIILVTCKFSKQVTFIKGADTWSAEQWAQAFFKRLNLIDWGLPKELITDQDPKFLSKFWAELFARLGVKLLYSMAYHP